MAKGAGFFGLLLVCFGVLLAYLYASGKWPAVWADITGTTAATGSSGTTSTAANTTSLSPASLDPSQYIAGSNQSIGSVATGSAPATTPPLSLSGYPQIGNTVEPVSFGIAGVGGGAAPGSYTGAASPGIGAAGTVGSYALNAQY